MHSLSQNYFELFNLPVGYRVDTDKLTQAYQAVQREVHPDKFAQAQDAARRASMQLAAHANEAYQALKSPLSRARYLLTLNGINAADETNTRMPADFLMAQIEWREALDDAHGNTGSLEKLETRLADELRVAYAELDTLFEKKDYPHAVEAVRKLMFLEKLKTEIADAIEVSGN